MPKLRDDIVHEIKNISNGALLELLELLNKVDIEKSKDQISELQKKHLQLQQSGELSDDADLVDLAYEAEHDLFKYIEILNDVRDVVNKIAAFLYDEKGLLKDE